MGSRLKEEEKNEKAIRSLLKKGANRKCINCNSLGPQYVCLNFWTFVCMQCSGIHREFTHRVKSVSMSKFSSQEVANLENGGNERGREIHFKDWDPQRQPLPDSSNVDKLRDFIKSVYVERRYSGERPVQRSRGGDREVTTESRSSELRSNNRPSYEDRYEDRQPGARRSNVGYEEHKYEERSGHYDERRNSRQFETGRDRHGRSYSDNRRYEEKFRYENRDDRVHYESREDRVHYENRGRQHEDRYSECFDRRFDEGCANGRRYSSGNREYGGSSPPPVRPVKEILGEDVPPLRVEGPASRSVSGHEMIRSLSLPDARAPRLGSSSSFGSVDGNVPVVKMESSGSLIDFMAEPAAPVATEKADPFGLTPAGQTVTSASSSGGWATFDMFSAATAGGPGRAAPALSANQAINDLPAHSNGIAQWPSMQTAGVPSSLESGAESWLSLVEPISQSPTSAAGSESSSTSSTPIPTTFFSAGQVQIVQDLPKASSLTFTLTPVPSAVSTSRQEISEGFFMGAQTGPHLTGAPFPVPEHTLLGGMSVPVGSYNQPQKSRNPFDLVDDSLTTSTAGEFPSMKPLQSSLPSLESGPISLPGSGVSSFGPQWNQTNTMVLPPASYTPAAPSGGLCAGQNMLNMMPQIMGAVPVGPSVGAGMPGVSVSASKQGAEPYFPIQGSPQVQRVPQLPLESPIEVANRRGISQDSLFFSQAGQHLISQSLLGPLGSIPGMSPLVPVQASPQFPTYNSLSPVSNPFY